jgi:hypothetical protein
LAWKTAHGPAGESTDAVVVAECCLKNHFFNEVIKWLKSAFIINSNIILYIDWIFMTRIINNK